MPLLTQQCSALACNTIGGEQVVRQWKYGHHQEAETPAASVGRKAGVIFTPLRLGDCIRELVSSNNIQYSGEVAWRQILIYEEACGFQTEKK